MIGCPASKNLLISLTSPADSRRLLMVRSPPVRGPSWVYRTALHKCAYRRRGSILWIASNYEWLVHDLKSEDIIYIREIFPDTTSMALGGLPWAGEPSESAAPVMPSVVTAARAAAELLAVIPAAPRGAGDRRGEPLPSGL